MDRMHLEKVVLLNRLIMQEILLWMEFLQEEELV